MAYRGRLHILLGILLWVVFGYYWYIVVQRPITEYTRIALIAVGSIVVLITLFLVVWVIHNQRIAKQLGRRNRRVTRPPMPAADFLGRTFIATSQEQLQSAPYVEIYIVETVDTEEAREHKVFRVSDKLPKQA